MSYLATVTFDLRGATSQNYRDLSESLARLGFRSQIGGDAGTASDLPTTTFAGKFTGASTAKVRDDLLGSVRTALVNLGLHGKFFLVVGDGWAWGIRTT